MTVSIDQTASDFVARLLAGRAEDGADWLKALRARALERANALPVPSTRDEDWRFTDLSPLYRASPAAGAGEPGRVTEADLAPFDCPEAGHRLVFVDGVPRAELCRGATVPGLLVGLLSAPGVAALAQPWLGSVAAYEQDPFAAANTASLRDGAVLHAARGTAVAAPVHVLFVSTRAEAASHPRLLVRAEPGSDLLLLEDHVSLVDGGYCVNAVAELLVGEGARVRHVRLQRDSRTAFHIATTAARVARDATYESRSVALGGRISRHNLHVLQDGPGTHFDIDGLALLGGRQLADTHSFLDHAHPAGTSRQLHKCVVSGGAHAVFNGRILVRPGAQQTSSAQESRNLLLSDKARVDTKPQLEIFADDVKCAHGAAVGQLEAEEVFYLRSRGLPEAAARALLTYGFAADAVDRIPVASVVASLRRAIVGHTGGPGIA